MGPASGPQSSDSSGRLFGIRLGDFGLFATLLLSFALAFASFFAVTFVSIFAILIYNTAGHHAVDFADAYKFIALPVGLVMLAVSFATLGFFWVRRKVRGD
ncbi:MAG TPA: hypothetical protein VGD64_07730 [Acidisarcina sp.]